jgi:hypothetical protein
MAYRFTTWAGRYGEAAPAACCGVCKPCVTTAATGLVMGAAGLSVQKVAGRRRDHEGDEGGEGGPAPRTPRGAEPA